MSITLSHGASAIVRVGVLVQAKLELGSTEHLLKNRHLFSTHYLREMLPRRPEWTATKIAEIREDFLRLYSKEAAALAKNLKEAQVEERFIRPVLRNLGFEFEVQEGAPRSADSPDYLLFATREAIDRARNENRSLVTHALAVCEAKRWDAELDKLGPDKRNKRTNPSFQIWLYLQETGVAWGILTNGRKWRLYHRDRPFDTFFEVDLVNLLETPSSDHFRYFHNLFRSEAFVADSPAGSFLDQVLAGSEDHAREIGEELKGNVFKAMRALAQGLFADRENRLSPDDHLDIVRVHENVMRLLYRFLFVLYAEGRGLFADSEYFRSGYSLHELKHEIAVKRDEGRPILSAGTAYWARLRDLFRLINLGSESFGISKTRFHIPAYNGGLFASGTDDFLDRWVVSDAALSEAIDLLARAPTDGDKLGFIDYSTLSVRHLGSVYEGLLEFRLRYAPKDMVAFGDNQLWIPYEDYATRVTTPLRLSQFEPTRVARAGEFYLATHLGERKLTGSYYTPDFVVRFIVRNAVGPAIQEKWQIAKKGRKSLVDAVLSVRVLDPAMGSGHFLVGATEFLAAKLMEAVQEDIGSGRVAVSDQATFTPAWARRAVVSHCIFGVDLNSMAVELAKVSLWLSTVSKDRPLTFLDHHVKVGNSLVGSTISDVAWLPGERPIGAKGHFDKERGLLEPLVRALNDLEETPDETLDDVKKKERLLDHLRASPEYLRVKEVADAHTGLQFSELDFDAVRSRYMNLVNEAYYGDQRKWQDLSKADWVIDCKGKATDEHAFHWELEFPLVFFGSGEGAYGGFDVVIGNPPYLNVKRGALESETPYLKANYQLATGQWDAFALFYEKGMKLVRTGGFWSMIIPKPSLSSENYQPLREMWLTKGDLRILADSGTPFTDPIVESVVVVVRKGKPTSRDVPIVGLSIDGESTTSSLPPSLVEKMPFKIIALRLTPAIQRILKKISNEGLALGGLGEITRGIEAGKSADFVRDAGVEALPLAFGEDCHPYLLRTLYSVRRDLGAKVLKPAELYVPPKLLIRRVASSLVAAVDGTNCHVLNTIYIFRPHSTQMDLHSLCAFLNSKIINYWFHHVFVFEDKLFPYTRVSQLSLVPIPQAATRSRALGKHAENIKELWIEYDGLANRVALGLESLGISLPSEAEAYHRSEALLRNPFEKWRNRVEDLMDKKAGGIPSAAMARFLGDGKGILGEVRAVLDSINVEQSRVETEVAQILGIDNGELQSILNWAASQERRDWHL